MAAFIRVVDQIAVVLYLACLAGIAWSIRSIWVALRERGNTLYSLEREAATTRIGRGVLSVLAFLALGALVFFVAQVVAPTLPALDAPTPTLPGPLVTLTPTVTPFPTPTVESSPTPESAPNPTLIAVEPLESPTPQPTTVPLPPADCPDPGVVISAPRDGDVFSGPFQVFGTANIDNFSFYKFVLNGPATNFQAQTVGDVYKSPVVGSYLGTIEDPVISILLASPGVYRLSLVAVNSEGNEAPHCVIHLVVQSPP